MGHMPMEDRNGLVIGTSLTKATAERDAAIVVVEDVPDGGRVTGD